MKVKTFVGHGDVEGLEAEVNLFLETLSSDPVFTDVAIDEHRIFVMIGYDTPPAATASVEPTPTAPEPAPASTDTSAAPATDTSATPSA